jgi:hypothetical protein
MHTLAIKLDLDAIDVALGLTLADGRSFRRRSNGSRPCVTPPTASAATGAAAEEAFIGRI